MIVAVLSYNHPEHTSRAVNSVRALVPDASILLVHNGSRAEVESRLRREFTGIHHVTVHENHGFSQGANIALRECFARDTDWVLFVTNDCELSAIGAMPPRPGLYAPLIFRRSRNKIDSIGGGFRPLTGRLRHEREVTSSRLGWKFYVPGTAFLIHRDTWRSLWRAPYEIYDESLHTYWEDVDLSMRAHALKLTMGVWPEFQFVHKVGKTCHKDPFYTRYLFQRNRAIVSRRYTSKWLRPVQRLFVSNSLR